MFRLFKILLAARPIVQAILRRLLIFLPLVLQVLAGCDGGSGAERKHVNALQTEVTRATRELVANEAEARKSLTETQKSLEQTRTTLTRQQTDIQSGLDHLESERKSIAMQRISDLMMSGTIESVGSLIACLVPFVLVGWLMLRFWQTDSIPEVDDIIISMAEQPHPTTSTQEIWKNHKLAAIADKRVSPESEDHDAWRQGA